jgi:hypothetical protein
MNPLSSFSFGKIIKTFIPGVIAAGAPLFLIEFAYRAAEGSRCAPGVGLWRCFAAGSFFTHVVLRDGTSAAAFGAAMVPLALMLGFFLNTGLWLCVNEWCRRWADSNMDMQLKGTRAALEARAIEGLTVVLRGQDPGAPRVHLHDFFLPVMDLDRLTFLRESYFSWFEFQINSAAALLLTGIAYAATIILLGHRWSLLIDWRIHLVIPIALDLAVIAFLVFAGEKNLRRYQEGFVWFLVGSLRFRAEP